MNAKSYLHTLLGLFLVATFVFACGSGDDRLASSSAKRQPYYDFFNDVRLEIADLEAQYSRLDGFTSETKKFLENRGAQQKYKIGGFYFEKGLNREQGAYDYADRFFPDGAVIHCIIYPPEQQSIWQNLLGYNKGKGKQVGQNYVYYQVFTAQPEDTDLEQKIETIIERNMEKHAAQIGALLN
ncbi:MAG: hypothetical protein AAFY48_21235 [Bacteroidota bacterium]